MQGNWGIRLDSAARYPGGCQNHWYVITTTVQVYVFAIKAERLHMPQDLFDALQQLLRLIRQRPQILIISTLGDPLGFTARYPGWSLPKPSVYGKEVCKEYVHVVKAQHERFHVPWDSIYALQRVLGLTAARPQRFRK